MTFRVVLDACVLIPIPLCDVLLQLADAELFQPLWSAELVDEVERNLVGKFGLTATRAAKRASAMTTAFPHARVEGYETLVPQMTNHPKDRHVLATAVRAGAGLIVTANLKDFPEAALAPYEIEAMHPGVFLLDLLDLDPELTWAALDRQRASYLNPPMTMPDFAVRLSRTVPHFAVSLLEASPPSGGGPRTEAPELPLPLESVDDGVAAEAFFGGQDPTPHTPLGAAFMWWNAVADE